MQVARKVGNTAWDTAVDWANKQGRPSATKREFCWFYDVFTQNGGLKSLTVKKVQDFIANHGASSADDLICDWLAGRVDDDHGAIDSRKNGRMWRDAVPDGKLFLFVASFLRIAESNSMWQSDALNRKGTIALGTGWAHGEKHDLTAITG